MRSVKLDVCVSARIGRVVNSSLMKGTGFQILLATSFCYSALPCSHKLPMDVCSLSDEKYCTHHCRHFDGR